MRAALLVLLAVAPVVAQNANTDWPAIGSDAGSTKYLCPLNYSRERKQTKTRGRVRYCETAGTDEITPIVIGNVMYVATVSQHLIALNAQTGAELWKYAPAGGGGRMSEYRGVSYWPGDAQTPARIIFTSGGKLIAVDAKNAVPLTKLWRHWYRRSRKALTTKSSTVTGDAHHLRSTKRRLLVRELAGRRGATEFPAIRALSICTLEEVWRFHTVPQPGEDESR